MASRYEAHGTLDQIVVQVHLSSRSRRLPLYLARGCSLRVKNTSTLFIDGIENNRGRGGVLQGSHYTVAYCTGITCHVLYEPTSMEARCVSLSSVRTDFTADAVAFCPYEGYRHLLACGCYQLMNDESPPRRTGQLLLFDATHADSPRELQCFDGPGVLDCQWLPVSAASPNLLVTASAEGGAHFYRLESGESPQPKLHDVGLLECEGAGWCIGLACSLPTAGASRIALGGTSGTVHVCAVATEGERLERSWQAHELECWAVGWAAHPEAAMTLFSGADDAMLKSWDLRCDPAQVSLHV